MSNNTSDVPAATDDEPDLEMIKIDNVLNDIKSIIGDNSQSDQKLIHYISKVESHLNHHQIQELNSVDKDAIKNLILRHPYFRNPCNYNIRLTTIMKYLKKKGIDVHLRNMDLLVDEVILSINGIEKKGYDKYFMKR
ncbi:MAG: hypothetical protein JXO44_10365 [Clostridia bacterium]|nr:hypothetical protein [Clostridia bacterium]